VIYTRNDDTFIALESRTELGELEQGGPVLSIHANSSPYPAVPAWETYYLNLTSARDALDLASRENSEAQMSIHELSDIAENYAA